MKKATFCIFGKLRKSPVLSAEGVEPLLHEAKEHAAMAADVPLNKIQDVLNRASAKWADPDYHLRKRAQKELPGLVKFSDAMVRAGLGVVSGICSRDSLEKRLLGELSGGRMLDGWVPDHGLGYDLRAVSAGPLLHLAAGNVFVGAVDSLVSGMLTKNANILKVSHVDPLFPGLFVESLREVDPEGLVWPHQAVVSWKGGDDAVERPLLGHRLTVVFWGGREALLSVRGKIGPETRLIENGPRYSFAVADKASQEAVRGLALDICRWDQQACSSPHVVYMIGPDNGPVFDLMDQLHREMDLLAGELPLGPLDFDEQVEIRKVRELALMAQALGEGRLVCPERFAYSLIFEQDPVFKISCLNRTVFFKRVKSVDELVRQVEPISEFLQTVGLNLEESRRKALEPELLRLGAKRLTPWGGMSEGCDGAPHEGSFLLTRLVDFVTREAPKELESSPSSTPKRDQRLDDLLAAAYHAPCYRDRIPGPGEALMKRFAEIPLLDRETLYKYSPPFSNDILTGPLTDAYVYASGGTTGRPKYIFYSNDEYRHATDVLTFIYETAGITKEDRVGNLFLAGNLWTSFNVAGRALENLGCLNLPIGGMTEFENLVQYVQDFRVNALVGLPSVIVKFAETVKIHGLKIKIEKILYGGEHMRAPTREFLISTLGCKWVRSAGYACVDTGPIGYQCPHVGGSVHHVLEDYQRVEILEIGEPLPSESSRRAFWEPDLRDSLPSKKRTIPPSRTLSIPGAKGRPAKARPEEARSAQTPLAHGKILWNECADKVVGEIVATNLSRILMPVIRFRTGDLGMWIPNSKCPCGFRGRTFELLGRCDDLMVIGGINLMPSDLAPGLAKLPVSPNFQAVARLAGGKEILVLRLECEEPTSVDSVYDALQEGSYKLAKGLKDGWLFLEIEWFPLGGIPRNPRTGKLKVMVDER